MLLLLVGLIFYVTAFANSDAIAVLGGTTSLLLLAVFAVVNVAVLVLRRDVREAGGQFRTPTALPVIGCLASLYLVTPLSGRPAQQYVLALILVAHRHSAVLPHLGDQPSARYPRRRHHRPDAFGFRAGLAESPSDLRQLELGLLQ